MAELLKPDLCVIGAGSGGLSVAAAAAAFGVPVVLVEKAKMGGDCLNTGCVPSKALIAAAARAHEMRHGAPFGVSAGNAGVDFGRVHAHVHQVIAAIAPNDSKERFTGLGVRVIAGSAAFADARTVTAGDARIKARRFVIATGSAPAVPPIPGLDGVPFLTNETIFDLRECPKHLVVIGAGPVGLELAQAFRRLGAGVTVIDAAQPLSKEDPECAAVVIDQLTREGVAIRAAVSVTRIEKAASGVRVFIKSDAGEEPLEGSHLLVATGRRPVTDGLALDKAGIAHDTRGITVDRKLRTTNSRVYAIGDAAGGAQFTHVANYHAGLVIRNALFRLPVSVNDDIIPRVTFTDPELAHVGLNEAQARERYSAIRIARWPFHENDRAQTERETAGHIKLVMASRGKILGVTIVGKGAGELIAPWTLAVTRGLNARAMAGVVLPYPTRGEIGKRAAIDFFTPSLTSPLLRRIIAFLRLFG
jgi:pyruvate/2-oxoglutarate dehydrogenase complex dihydrolipoamide dehydrogenase (E3) component